MIRWGIGSGEATGGRFTTREHVCGIVTAARGTGVVKGLRGGPRAIHDVAMSINKKVKKAAEVTAWNPIQLASQWGVRSSHAYTAGFIAVAVSFISWLISRKKDDSKAQSDRWGLFIGEWAPTFFAIGIALKHEEE